MTIPIPLYLLLVEMAPVLWMKGNIVDTAISINAMDAQSVEIVVTSATATTIFPQEAVPADLVVSQPHCVVSVHTAHTSDLTLL